jgi:integrase
MLSQPKGRAFEWLVLTASRSGETRLAGWTEIDEQAHFWTIPAERMKVKRPHMVPLSVRCLEILKHARAMYPASHLIFPGTRLASAHSVVGRAPGQVHPRPMEVCCLHAHTGAVSMLSVLADTPGMMAPMQANILPPTFRASCPPPPDRTPRPRKNPADGIDFLAAHRL